jgi:hypothetical protein
VTDADLDRLDRGQQYAPQHVALFSGARFKLGAGEIAWITKAREWMPRLIAAARERNRLAAELAALRAAAQPIKHWFDERLSDDPDGLHVGVDWDASNGPTEDMGTPTVGQLRTLARLLPAAPEDAADAPQSDAHSYRPGPRPLGYDPEAHA